MARRNPRAARDPLEYHDVMITLSKAKALASVLQQLGEGRGGGGNDRVTALTAVEPEWLYPPEGNRRSRRRIPKQHVWCYPDTIDPRGPKAGGR